MSTQNTNPIGNMSLPGLEAFMKLMSESKKVSHNNKYNDSQSEIKQAVVERYKRDYLVNYIMEDGKVQLEAIDGNNDLEDTYNEKFLQFMEEKIEESERSKSDNDDRYDDYFQNL